MIKRLFTRDMEGSIVRRAEARKKKPTAQEAWRGYPLKAIRDGKEFNSQRC